MRASVTRTGARLKDLEDTKDHPDTPARAQLLVAKLESLDVDFKNLHLQIVDLLDDEEELEREQLVLDSHDDKVSMQMHILQQLCTVVKSPVDSVARNLISRKLAHLERVLISACDGNTGIPDEHGDQSLILHFQEHLTKRKSELALVLQDMLAADIPEDDALSTLHARLEECIFQSSHRLRKLLTPSETTTPAPAADPTGVKLPKLDTPTFDGELLNWKPFWEQFCLALHDRARLTDAEKLAYLRNAVKDGTARSVIEGLTKSSEEYSEAIDCLKARYDRPRLIHQTHVKCILDSPLLKEGSGRELRRLHDTVQQHLRALKSLGHEPSPSFITSLIELKLDVNTMFEWQKHSHDQADVPPYTELLAFIDHRAQASEAALPPTKRNGKQDSLHKKPAPRPAHSYTASTEHGVNCVLCKNEKHPLYKKYVKGSRQCLMNKNYHF